MTWAGLRVHGQSLWYQAIIAAASRRATNPGLEYVGTERLLLALPDDAHAERPSDELSDNRHRQRWTPADTHGRSAAGHATWLRDEEAAGSNPATPTQVRAPVSRSGEPAFLASVRQTCATRRKNVRHHGRPDAAARLPHDSITLSCASGAR